MGRYVSLAIEPTVYFGIRDVKAGYGSGAFRFYGTSGTFTIPSGVTEVRVTALGAGGAGSNWCRCNCCCFCPVSTGSGGGGGGYIVATVPVTPGCVCNIAVGAATGGSSCFGLMVYAYGGCSASTGYGTTTAGAGGTFCACSGATLIAGYCGNNGCTGSTNLYAGQWPGYVSNYSQGGASGSPMGGNCTGPFPGISGTDVYSCKGFNGEASDESSVAAKFSNTIRWPGEALLSTSRLAKVVAGTAAGYPDTCYCVSVFGGANSTCCACAGGSPRDYINAGCGGGQAGCLPGCFCCNYYGYGTCACLNNSCSFAGSAGNGFVVVEY